MKEIFIIIYNPLNYEAYNLKWDKDVRGTSLIIAYRKLNSKSVL